MRELLNAEHAKGFAESAEGNTEKIQKFLNFQSHRAGRFTEEQQTKTQKPWLFYLAVTSASSAKPLRPLRSKFPAPAPEPTARKPKIHLFTGLAGSSNKPITSLICAWVKMPASPKRGMPLQALKAWVFQMRPHVYLTMACDSGAATSFTPRSLP